MLKSSLQENICSGLLYYDGYLLCSILHCLHFLCQHDPSRFSLYNPNLLMFVYGIHIIFTDFCLASTNNKVGVDIAYLP
jgi:hypothetical protein